MCSVSGLPPPWISPQVFVLTQELDLVSFRSVS